MYTNISLLLKLDYVCVFVYIRLLGCAAGGHFVSAGGALWAPGSTMINYKGNNIFKYVCPTVLIDIARKISKFINFKNFDE